MSSEITIERLCDICLRVLEPNESHNPFPYLESGSCCEVCNETVVLETRRICLSAGFYYATQRRECIALVNHLKAVGVLKSPRYKPVS